MFWIKQIAFPKKIDWQITILSTIKSMYIISTRFGKFVGGKNIKHYEINGNKF